MDLTYPPEVADFRRELRAWLSEQLPAAWAAPGFWATLGEDEAFDLRRGWERRKALAGFGGIDWPVEYGGRGGSATMAAVADAELMHARAPRSVNPLGLTFLAPTVMAVGTPRQKAEILAPMLRNEVIWCQGFSEPESGSDLGSVRTRGERDGDEFVVNGQKVWTTSARRADRMFALVRTDPAAGRHRGLSLLLVDLRSPGVEVRPIRQMSGISEFGEVFFTDVRVPAADCVGGLGNGWATAMLLLSFERGSSAMGQYTDFRRAYDQIVEVARALGRDRDPLVRQSLARRLVELECLRYHALHVLTEVERGRDLGFASSVTKLQWSQTYQDLFDTLDEVLGADVGLDQPLGELGDLDLTALRRESFWSRSVTIWGGSSQIQRSIVAERVLGLPRGS
ncbi:acyl-CoA dehydrogenase family protein [Frankia sp. R82]|uniref:acyl-CoA dehydrogenase family protein n=1 Tax=Frankia sp. R82 TaxID=2950553 RepID=UPI0020435605|nr:acyl-CoA dehydrogenase family protein [Frankia sp. R82]MCM3885396.1 acyl-CoA dehydrogenase family protein [Frankia sp. R82]